jgi:hypothetical protein
MGKALKHSETQWCKDKLLTALLGVKHEPSVCNHLSAFTDLLWCNLHIMAWLLRFISVTNQVAHYRCYVSSLSITHYTHTTSWYGLQVALTPILIVGVILNITVYLL